MSTVATYSQPQAPRPTSGGHEGEILDDTYRVGRLIGLGGMSAVHEATHLRLGHRVAIKFLDKTYRNYQEAYARFRREAEIASSLGHDNIAKVSDFNTLPDGTPYMVMEMLDGEDLGYRLTRGPLSVDEVIAVSEQLASALGAAHKGAVVHRDLKPDNIFLCVTDEGLTVKVLDFGISKIRGAIKTLTKDAQLIGTPGYMSPEQARGDKGQVDHRSDIYSVGAVLYEALCGKPAYDGENVFQILTRIATMRPAPIPGFSPAVDAVLQRAMAGDPAARYASVGELHRALVFALTGKRIRATSTADEGIAELVELDALEVATPVPEPAIATAPTRLAEEPVPALARAPWRSRQRLAIVGAVAVLGVAVAVAVGIAAGGDESRPQPAPTAVAPPEVPAPTPVAPPPPAPEPTIAPPILDSQPAKRIRAPARSHSKPKAKAKPALVTGAEL